MKISEVMHHAKTFIYKTRDCYQIGADVTVKLCCSVLPLADQYAVCSYHVTEAGKGYYVIWLNAAGMTSPEVVRATVAHELVHVEQREELGRMNHDSSFKARCRVLRDWLGDYFGDEPLFNPKFDV